MITNYRNEISKRTIRTAPQAGKHHGEGPSDGAQRNARIAAASAAKKADSKDDKEKKIADRSAAAEKRKKETLAMATEDSLTESKHVFHVHMKADDTRSHKMVDDKTSEPIGAKPKSTKLVLKVSAADTREARNKVSRHIAKNYGVSAVKSIKYKGLDEEVSGTEARTKIKNVARPGDAEPTSEKSLLSKNGEIKVKKVDEENYLHEGSMYKTRGYLNHKVKYHIVDNRNKLVSWGHKSMEDAENKAKEMEKEYQNTKKNLKTTKSTRSSIAESFSRNFGLSDSLTDTTRSIIEKTTQVDLDPETNDMTDEDADVKKERKKYTTPKTDKEKKLAALAHPKDKITHKDILVGRGVLNKEEAELDEAIKIGSRVKIHAPGKDYHGVVGNVGEIDHGLHNKSIKRYTVDYNNRSKSVTVSKPQIKLHTEEVENIDELKKSTLASYTKKASNDATKHSYMAGKTGDVDTAAKASKRIRGIDMATNKLAKEEFSDTELARIEAIAVKFDIRESPAPSTERGLQDHEPRIVSGGKGMKSNSFSKKFPHQKAMEKWMDSDDYGNHEVHRIERA